MRRVPLVLVLVASCVTLLASAPAAPPSATVLLHVARRAPDDLARLRASGVPVVRETSRSLFVEGPLAESSRLAALGYDVQVLDGAAATADYWQIGLRPDSDLGVIDLAGVVLFEEENWVLLRVPRGLGAAPLENARAFLSPLPHRAVDVAAGDPAPARGSRTDAAPQAAPDAANPLIQTMVAAVTPAMVNQYWNDLTANPPTGTRYSTSQGARDAAQYTKNQLEALGVAAQFHEWSTSHAPNVVGEIPGAIDPAQIYIVIGHMDDLPSSGPAPGADDNASGTVNILANAKAMACYAYRKTVRFIACTGEEQGLLGSDAYAAEAKARNDDIRGVLNMDMIAWEGNASPSPENLDLNYNAASQGLGELFAASATTYGTGVAIDAFLCPGLTASDHASFWDRGYQAVCGITDNEGYCGHAGNYPYYHQSTDTIANCGNPAFFYGVVKTSVATLATLAEPFKLAFDRSAAACDGTVGLILGDRDLNTDPGTVQAVAVEVWSDTETTPETLVLTEEGANSMLFRAQVVTTPGPPVAGDGRVSVGPTDTLRARYVDALDCDGATAVPHVATLPVDCLRPVVSNVRERDVSQSAATIAWTTDESSDSAVVWGSSRPPLNTTSDAMPVTEHAVALTGLAACTTYWYEVRSADAAGNVTSSDNGGSFYRFETKDADGNNCHAGAVKFTRPAVACADVLAMQLSDMDLNASAGVVDTVAVTVTSSTEPDPESVTLTETGPNTARFEGQIPTTGGPAVHDGRLQLRNGDLVTATYVDADDGSGGPAVSNDTVVADCAGPRIPTLTVSGITENSAVVSWTTDEIATARIDWGASPALGNAQTDAGGTTSHSFTLAPLAECGRVYFKLTATDVYGNVTLSDLGGALHQFNAWKVPGLVFRDGFETATGWTLEGDWQIGAPQGKGTAPADPTAAYEGSKVLGQDLTGLGAKPGDYERGSTYRALSPYIDATTLRNGELRFRRWLNTRSSAIAAIDVERDGSWNQAWRSSPTFGESASSWSDQKVDISALADGNPHLRIAFREVAGSSFDTRSGWNVDRLFVRDATAADYGACGGCGGAPSFAGATGATDVDPCAAGAVTVTWDEAPAWGTGTPGTYAVYRSTDPSFVPSATTLLAQGIAGTSYSGTTAPGGVPLYYVVRAENAETCGGGPHHGGMTDGNLVRAAARDDAAQPAPGDVGPTLRARSVNAAHVRLAWDPVAGAARYDVWRGDDPAAALQKIAEPAASPYEDRGEAANAITWFYLVRAADACGNEGP